MRVFVATLAATGTLLAAAPIGAAAHTTRAATVAQRTLNNALSEEIHAAGNADGAYVVDLSTGRTLFSSAPAAGRLPASVEKLYTASTALLRFGSNATLTTTVLGKGWRGRYGGWHGVLYIRGGGDPTFGSIGFDQSAYGTGATMGRLVANLIRAAGIRSVSGRIVGDESYFDSLRGTPPYSYQFSPDVEGSLSALAYNRGLIDQGAAYVVHPARYAAQQFESSLRAQGVRVPAHTAITAGVTPSGARLLATVRSPRIATLVRLTNTPSDNFFAEMLLKGIGARFGGGGTTAMGAAVVRAQLATTFHIHPSLEDGSGLSRNDSTSPRQVVTVLARMASNRDFVRSLAVAGETGTLQNEMQGTAAQGRCRGKTGTLHDVSNLVGYCRAQDGHTLAFAFLMNSIDPANAHPIQNRMAVALAQYDG